jgi:hypothetical protein
MPWEVSMNQKKVIIGFIRKRLAELLSVEE